MVSSALLLIVLLFLLSNAAVLPPGEPDSITTRRFRQVRAPLPTPDFPGMSSRILHLFLPTLTLLDIPPYAIPTGFFGQLHPDRGMGTVGTASGTGFGTGTGTAPSTCKMTETPKPTTTVTEKAALATKAFADMSKAAQETPLQQYLGNWRPDSTWKTASTSWTAGAWPTAPPELFKTCGSEQGTAYWTGNEQSKGITFKKSLMRDFVMASLDEAKEKKTILSYRGQTGWPAMGDKDAKSPSGTDCQITNSKHMTAYVSVIPLAFGVKRLWRHQH